MYGGLNAELNASLMNTCLAKRIAIVDVSVVDKLRIRYLHPAPADPCAELQARKVESMLFIGDSYVRMAYQAMGLWLSNNYRNASMHPDATPFVVEKQCAPCKWNGTGTSCTAKALYNPEAIKEVCDFEGQFRDGQCRGYILPRMSVCGGAVKLVMRASYLNSCCTASAFGL